MRGEFWDERLVLQEWMFEERWMGKIGWLI